jgi:segment polarity protein dishevelled
LFILYTIVLVLSGFGIDLNLTVNSDMDTIVRAMAESDSGLDIRDRIWLKIPIPKSFLG